MNVVISESTNLSTKHRHLEKKSCPPYQWNMEGARTVRPPPPGVYAMAGLSDRITIGLRWCIY